MALMLLLLCIDTVAAGNARSAKRYDESHPLVYEDSWLKWPYAYVNDEGEPTGFNVELMQTVMRRLKVPFRVELKEQKQVHLDLADGVADLTLGTVGDYNARYGTFGHETVLLTTNSILVACKDSAKHITLDDLRKRPIVVKYDSRAYHYLREQGFEDSLITVTRNMETTIRDMATYDYDGAVWNTMMLKWNINKYGLQDKFCTVPISMPPGEYRVMGRDTVLLSRIDSVLRQMNKDGEIEEMANRWLYPEREEKSNIPWPLIISLVGSLVALGVIYYSINRYHRFYQHLSLTNVRAQMKLLLEANHMDVWVYFPDTRRYAWMTPDGMVKRDYNSFSFSHFFPDDDFATINADVMEIVANNKSEPIHETLRCYDETQNQQRMMQVDVKIQGLFDDYGKIYLVCGVTHDISDTKANVERLRTMRDCFHTTFDMMPCSLLHFDSDGRLREVNDRCAMKLAVEDKDELIAQMPELRSNYYLRGIDVTQAPDVLHFCKRLTRADLLEIMQELPAINTRLGYDHTRSERMTDSEYIARYIGYYDVKLVKNRDRLGHIVGYILFVKEITAEVSAQTQLRKKKELEDQRDFDMRLMRNSRNFVIEVTGTWMVTYYPERKQLMVRDSSSNKNRLLSHLQILRYVRMESLDSAFHALQRMDAHRPGTVEVEAVLRVRKQDSGQPLHVRLVLHPIYNNESGQLDRYMGTCVDVTDSVNSAAAIAEYNRQAAEANLMRQNFIRNISHAMRHPLAAIHNDIKALGRSSSEDNDRTYVDRIKQNTQQLVRLTDDTLLLSRLETKTQKLMPTVQDFVSIFYAAIREVQAEYPPSEDLRYDVSNIYPELPMVIDPLAMKRILHEVLSLSARFTTIGTISVKYAIRGNEVSLMVEDTSQGLPQQLLDHMFETNVNLTQSLSDMDQSRSGLELPILKHLVDLCGGTIDITSVPGRGTQSWITLPVHIPTLTELDDLGYSQER